METLKNKLKSLKIGYICSALFFFLAFFFLIMILGLRIVKPGFVVLFYIFFFLFLILGLLTIVRLRMVKVYHEKYLYHELIIYLGLNELILIVDNEEVFKVKENFYLIKSLIKVFKKEEPISLIANFKKHQVKINVSAFHQIKLEIS